MENKRIISKSTTILLLVKLFVINGLIIAFGFGIYHLISIALEDQNPSLLGTIVPLGMAVIGLITLEIQSLYKMGMKILDYRHQMNMKGKE